MEVAKCFLAIMIFSIHSSIPFLHFPIFDMHEKTSTVSSCIVFRLLSSVF